MLSSNVFSPALFLSHAHSNDSTQALLQGLDYLSRSIDQKTAALKQLVESNFERFIKAKATLDSVYQEMRNHGPEANANVQRVHSRHTSKSSNHFRNTSGSGSGVNSGVNSGKPISGDKKKNALVKETEYGVQGIKIPMSEVSIKAQELWGPAMGGIEREERMKAILSLMAKYRGIFEAPAIIANCIRHRDYQNLAEEYARARRHASEARHIADTAMESGVLVTDPQVHHIIVTAQMWIEVEEQIEEFKRDVWRRLVETRINGPYSSRGRGGAGAGGRGGVNSGQSEDHMELISVLLELGVQDNPIWVWLLSEYDYLKRKIHAVTERFRLEVELMRRRLAATTLQSSSRDVASRLRTALRLGGAARGQRDVKALDTPRVMDLWEGIYASLQVILSSRGGILGEVITFWETAQAFIDGRTQRTLPVGIDGASRPHHRLSAESVRDLRNGLLELINLMRDGMVAFFVDPPPEDLSSLSLRVSAASERLSTVLLPQSVFKDAGMAMAIREDHFPPMLTTGQSWEKFAFWPPHSNSVAGVHYLGKIIVLVCTAASEMTVLSPVAQTDNTTMMMERLKGLVGGARERSVQAICVAWNGDAENCKAWEDWDRAGDQKDVTRMPSYFATFETEVLSGLQRILYVSDVVTTTAGSTQIVPPPRAKLLQLVRSQFVTSLYKSLSGMVENAERAVEKDDDEWVVNHDGRGLVSPSSTIGAAAVASTASAMSSIQQSPKTLSIDEDRNIRMLLTLGNLQSLRREIVPQLISQFENSFSVKLTDESKTIRDVLGQIDARLFHTYIRPSVTHLTRIIRAGVLSPTWAPAPGTRPTEVRRYVYDALLALVLVHSQVSSTSPSLTPQIMSYLLEQISREFLDVFRHHPHRRPPRYTLAALMQATLDVEFLAQTLSQYTTEKASDIQAQIYLELGKTTTSTAGSSSTGLSATPGSLSSGGGEEMPAEQGQDLDHSRLQTELPEMRNVLKTLRDQSRAEFACFKKPRSARVAVTPVGSSGSGGGVVTGGGAGGGGGAAATLQSTTTTATATASVGAGTGAGAG